MVWMSDVGLAAPKACQHLLPVHSRHQQPAQVFVATNGTAVLLAMGDHARMTPQLFMLALFCIWVQRLDHDICHELSVSLS